MNVAKCFCVATLLLAATSWRAIGQEDIKKVSTETLISDLADAGKRVAATAELFRRGKDVLPDLKKAGAKQVAPVGGTVDGTKRIDMIYSVIEGFTPNLPNAKAGYKTNSFGLHVEKTTTAEGIEQICKKHQCTLVGKFNAETRPSCYLEIGPDQSLAAIIQQVLSTEPNVTGINLNYFES